MKTIDSIIIHCTATPEGKPYTAQDINRMHKQRGFSMIGYNFLVLLDGVIELGRPLNMDGAHCLGYNNHSIGVCYVGGLDKAGKPKDTRTQKQKEALQWLVADLCKKHDIVEVLGHRDTSPDLDGDGIVEPHEWIKSCPCFDVRSEFTSFIKPTIIKPKK